jgi:polysaccharide pyruvyl transferase WcaK-like protein
LFTLIRKTYSKERLLRLSVKSTIIFDTRESAFYICHKNQREDTQDNEKERDEAVYLLMLLHPQFARTADLLWSLTPFAWHVVTTRGDKSSPNRKSS